MVNWEKYSIVIAIVERKTVAIVGIFQAGLGNFVSL